MKLPVRTVIVRLSSGLVMLSPGSKLSDADYRPVSGITDIVAPSFLHWAGVPNAVRNFPNARTWGSAKVHAHHKEVKWTHTLAAPNWTHKDELPIVELRGIPKIEEFIFFHKKSRTLIVTDLVFNLVGTRGIGPWIILSLFGTYRRFGVSKFFLKFLEDRDAFKASLAELFSFDFDNIIMSHGDPIYGGAKDKLHSALRERGL